MEDLSNWILKIGFLCFSILTSLHNLHISWLLFDLDQSNICRHTKD